LNFEILLPAVVTSSVEMSANAHAAGDVPANFVQFTQWQNRAERRALLIVKVVDLHKQEP
jgi:hypothetical protein